jgi:hypothetical protein
MQKTVIGAFDSYAAAQNVVRDLQADGFMARDMNVLAHNLGEDADIALAQTASEPNESGGAATGAAAGSVVGGAAGLAASLIGIAIPGIGPILAAGPIVAALTGAGVGAVAGGLIGGLNELGVSEEHARYYVEALRRGGALVTLQCDATRSERAEEIMRAHGAIDIGARVLLWQEGGWRTDFRDAHHRTTTDRKDR